jgi:arsenate reductase (thioredoxin)
MTAAHDEMPIKMTRVLFVCVHNAGRSQMAEAFFNQMARERGLDAVAESAGTASAEGVNPIAAQVMEEVGVSLEKHRPRPLTPALAAADRFITMGCGVEAEACPAGIHAPAEDWQLPDPHSQPVPVVREIREAVRQRVVALLDELAASPMKQA